MKALVIDSSLANRERIIDLLLSVNNIGIISQAEDMETAGRMIGELQSELVVLNTYLSEQRAPRTNSITLLKRIKHRDPSTVVIMVQDPPYLQNRLEYLTLGAEFFLDTSCNFDQLPKIIEGLLQGSSKSVHGFSALG